ncbi:MAG: TonB-dependent receptor [Steroidobacteraceae bacterium]|jgi:outer membrane receptor protein involved in Fe transport
MKHTARAARTAAAVLFIELTSSPLSSPAVAADADTPSDEPTSLSAIVVTAERRAESIQSVPLSVTAISGNTLAAFDQVNFDDYAHLAPNLSFGTGNTFGITNGREITIRGIAGANTTSYYINDTPLPISIDPRAIDLDRIEVLRGPQGTLFGSSAMGGTVRLITRQPDLTQSFGSADAQGYVIHDGGPGYLVSASYNLPILDNQLALLVSGYSTYNPGVFTGEYGIATTAAPPSYSGGAWPTLTVPASQPRQTVTHLGNDVEAGETISLTYRPAFLDALTITPMVMHQDQSNNGFPLADYTTQNLIQVRPLNNRESDDDIWTFANLTAKFAAPFGSFIESGTYFHRYSRDTEDGSELISIGGYGGPPLGGTCVAGVYCPSPSPNWVNTNQFTDELRFESAFPGPVQLVTGAYYSKVRQWIVSEEVLPYDQFGNPAFTEDIPRVNEEVAAFGSLTYDILDKVELSVGVRQSHLEYSNIYIANGWINGGPSFSPAESGQRATTPRFTAKYKFDESNMVYANAAKGYRLGGANSVLPSACGSPYADEETPYKSDSLWSYELGTKNSWFDNRVNTRLAVYWIDWKNIQQSILLGCSFHVTENLGTARSRGAELEVDGTPLPGLYVNAGLGFEDAALTSAPAGSPLPVGSPLNGVPRWTGSLLGDYSWPVSFGREFVRAQYSFTGSSISDNNPTSVLNPTLAQRERGSYSLLNVFVGGKHESWETSLFVKNLCDVRGNLGDEQSEISELPGRPRWMITQPRTIGIDIKKQF